MVDMEETPLGRERSQTGAGETKPQQTLKGILKYVVADVAYNELIPYSKGNGQAIIIPSWLVTGGGSPQEDYALSWLIQLSEVNSEGLTHLCVGATTLPFKWALKSGTYPSSQ